MLPGSTPDENAILLPSGDQAGVAVVPPSAWNGNEGRSKRDRISMFGPLFPRYVMNAIFSPSGAQLGMIDVDLKVVSGNALAPSESMTMTSLLPVEPTAT